MTRSYQIFTLGLFLSSIIFFQNYSKQGNIRLTKKQEFRADKTLYSWQSDFGPTEAIQLPIIRHVVADFPKYDILINHSESFNGIKYRTLIPELKLNDVVEFRMSRDTLFIYGKINLNKKRYRNSEGKVFRFEEAGTIGFPSMKSIHISVQTDSLQSFTLLNDTYGQVFMQFPEYTDDNLGRVTEYLDEILEQDYHQNRIEYHLHKGALLFSYLNTKKMDITYYDGVPLLNLIHLVGKLDRLNVNNPAGRVGYTNGFVVDSLILKGEPNIYDFWEFRIKDYLYTDLKGKNKFHLKYLPYKEPITVEGQFSKYHLISEVQ